MCDDAACLPAELQSMCCAVAFAPDIRGQDATVRAELALHGETRANLDNLVRTFAARRFLLEELLAGRLYDRPQAVVPVAPAAAQLNDEQRQVFSRVVAQLQADPESRRCIMVTGGPGSGKMHLLLALATLCSAQYRVGVCAFSGLQSSRLYTQQAGPGGHAGRHGAWTIPPPV